VEDVEGLAGGFIRVHSFDDDQGDALVCLRAKILPWPCYCF
jgi:hypothetical protein